MSLLNKVVPVRTIDWSKVNPNTVGGIEQKLYRHEDGSRYWNICIGFGANNGYGYTGNHHIVFNTPEECGCICFREERLIGLSFEEMVGVIKAQYGIEIDKIVWR